MANQTILIIDYEPRSIQALSTPLEAAGFKIEIATDGLSGLKVFEQVKPGLVLIEAMLPKKHGFEVCQEIKKTAHGKLTPVVITTGVYRGRKYRTQALHIYRCDEYLEKPFPEEKLLETVHRFLGVAIENAPAATPETSPAPSTPPTDAVEKTDAAAEPRDAKRDSGKPSGSSSAAPIVADLTEQEITARLDAILPGEILSSTPSLPDASGSTSATTESIDESAEPSRVATASSDVAGEGELEPAAGEENAARDDDDLSHIVPFDVARRRLRRSSPETGPSTPQVTGRGPAGALPEQARVPEEQPVEAAAEPRDLPVASPVEHAAPAEVAEAAPVPMAEGAEPAVTAGGARGARSAKVWAGVITLLLIAGAVGLFFVLRRGEETTAGNSRVDSGPTPALAAGAIQTATPRAGEKERPGPTTDADTGAPPAREPEATTPILPAGRAEETGGTASSAGATAPKPRKPSRGQTATSTPSAPAPPVARSSDRPGSPDGSREASTPPAKAAASESGTESDDAGPAGATRSEPSPAPEPSSPKALPEPVAPPEAENTGPDATAPEPGPPTTSTTPAIEPPPPATHLAPAAEPEPTPRAAAKEPAVTPAPRPRTARGDLVDLGEVDERPVSVSHELPAYPFAARHMRQEGTVTLRLLIDEAGRVEKVELLEGTRWSSLNDAAMAAARDWTYRPASKDGVAVKVWQTEQVVFKL